MIKWTVLFLLGIRQRGKSGKREIAVWLFLAWSYGYWRVGVNEALGMAMPLTSDILRFTFPFMAAVLAGAFGLEHVTKRGWRKAVTPDTERPE